MHVDDFLKW